MTRYTSFAVFLLGAIALVVSSGYSLGAAMGVAIDRHGDIVKSNRGLHRLAMAQVLGLDEIVVRVRAVHVEWWRQVTQGETGERALQQLVKALPACQPAPLVSHR